MLGRWQNGGIRYSKLVDGGLTDRRLSVASNTPSVPSAGSDLEGTRYERLQLGSAFGYRDLILVYEPRAQFSDWDMEYLEMSAKQMLESARRRMRDEHGL